MQEVEARLKQKEEIQTRVATLEMLQDVHQSLRQIKTLLTPSSRSMHSDRDQNKSQYEDGDQLGGQGDCELQL